MNEDLTKNTPDNDDPFAWMRPFMAPPMRLSRNAQEQPYAPPARDPLLRAAQEEGMLEDEIWKLALSEAYSANNLGWLNRMAGCEKRIIVDDYYRRHPAMERFVKKHIEAGTCGHGLTTLLYEADRRKAGHDAGLGSDGTDDSTKSPLAPRKIAGGLNELSFTKSYIADQNRQGIPPTKRGLEAAWQKAGKSGGRQKLRDAFDEILAADAPRRGRPQKSPK